VKSIAGAAFRGCSGLTSITIPESVTSIGKNAFYNCSGLTSITIPESVTSIGEGAFNNCSGLTSVYVNRMTPINISEDVFSNRQNANLYVPVGCKDAYTTADYWREFKEILEKAGSHYVGDIITATTVEGIEMKFKVISPTEVEVCSETIDQDVTGSVTIPEMVEEEYHVTSIGLGAFYNGHMDNVTAINIPNSVTSIGDYAFAFCGSMTSAFSISIPNNVTTIGNHAFFMCQSLQSVKLGSQLTSIGIAAFTGCYNIQEIVCKAKTPPTCEDGALSSINKSDCKLYVPTGSLSAYQAADQWKEFKEIFEIVTPTTIVFADANVKAICVAHWDTDGDGELSCDEAAAVTTVYDYFKNNTSITSFNEFAYFTGITSIDNSAFEGCNGLISIAIPKSVTSIGKLTFMDCYGLKKVIVSDIAAWCGISFNDSFSNPLSFALHLYSDENTEITDLVIPDGVTNIGNYAFVGCSLHSITIPISVKSIGEGAFMGCGLTSITIPNSVTNIGISAFEGCEDLISITIPNSVTNIGSLAFSMCTSLTKVIVSDIAAWCRISFDDSSSNPLSYAQHLYSDENTEITDLVIPNGVTSISNYAFSNCSGLTSVTIPESVTSIGNVAFSDCSGLASVTIGSGVTSIGNSAFQYCGLTSVTVLNPTPVAITQDVFSNQKDATLYVPKGSKSAYQAANYWQEFKEIIEINITGIDQIMSNENNNATIFTLDGKRVNKPQKGINIIGGKKVVVK
jgi:hypothetical protein